MITTALESPYAQFRRRKHFAPLDGFRGVCILLVLLVHSVVQAPFLKFFWPWIAGGLGVDGFFVLSGFLITTLALREEEDRGKLSLRNFYIRRSFRIFPLYFLVVGIYCILSFGFHADSRVPHGLPYFLTFTNEFSPVDVFAQGWSLGVEEKFYFVWPVLAFGLWRCSPARRFAGTLALIALPLLLGWLTGAFYRQRGVHWIPGYSEIMTGALLAQCLQERAFFERVRFPVWAALPLIPLHLAFGVFRELHAPVIACLQVAYAAAVALFLAVSLTRSAPWNRLLESSALTLLGRRSYAIYLVHTLCLAAVYRLIPNPNGAWQADLTRLVLLLGSCLAVAQVLYLTVEKPTRDFGRRLTVPDNKTG